MHIKCLLKKVISEIDSEKQSFDVTCTVYLDNARSLDATISAGSLSRTRTWTSDINSATIYKITLEDKIS